MPAVSSDLGAIWSAIHWKLSIVIIQGNTLCFMVLLYFQTHFSIHAVTLIVILQYLWQVYTTICTITQSQNYAINWQFRLH